MIPRIMHETQSEQSNNSGSQFVINQMRIVDSRPVSHTFPLAQDKTVTDSSGF